MEYSAGMACRCRKTQQCMLSGSSEELFKLSHRVIRGKSFTFPCERTARSVQFPQWGAICQTATMTSSRSVETRQ